MSETDFIMKYAPIWSPILGLLIIVALTRRYLFQGMVSESQYKEMLARERELVSTQEKTAANMQEIMALLENLTKKVSEEIGAATDRVKSLEVAMADFLDQMRELNYNFEMHRKGVPGTEVFLKERKKA